MENNRHNYVSLSSLIFKRGQRVVFNGVDINIPKGKITAIMGPSGTGKTTLLRLMVGQLKPNHGSVTVNEQIINELSSKALFTARREMGLMFQSNALFTGMSVYENVAFPLRVHTDFSEEMIHQLVLMKLEAVGLRGAFALQPSELSGGMARRVALARAIALDPKLMMYDEPFTGQDPISMGILTKLIRELNDNLNMTTVIVSHDVTEIMQLADYIYLIGDGKVLAHGIPAEMQESAMPEVIQFVRGLPDGPVPFRYPASEYETQLLERRSDD